MVVHFEPKSKKWRRFLNKVQDPEQISKKKMRVLRFSTQGIAKKACVQDPDADFQKNMKFTPMSSSARVLCFISQGSAFQTLHAGKKTLFLRTLIIRSSGYYVSTRGARVCKQFFSEMSMQTQYPGSWICEPWFFLHRVLHFKLYILWFST